MNCPDQHNQPRSCHPSGGRTIIVPPDKSWITAYEEEVLALSHIQRANSVLIVPDSLSDSMVNISKLSTKITKSLSQHGGGFCPDVINLTDFFMQLDRHGPAGSLSSSMSTSPMSPTSPTSPLSTPHMMKASSHLVKLVLRQALASHGHHLQLADLAHIIKLLRYITHSEVFFQDHFEAAASSAVAQPRPIYEYFSEFTRFSENSARHFNQAGLNELAQLLKQTTATLENSGYCSMESLIAQKLISLGARAYHNPEFIQAELKRYHCIFVGGFITTTYLEEVILNQWLQPLPESQFHRLTLVQTMISGGQRAPTASTENSTRTRSLIPQPATCIDHQPLADYHHQQSPLKRVAIGFDSRIGELTMMLNLARQFCERGIPPEQIGILLAQPGSYQDLFGGAHYQLSKSSPLSGVNLELPYKLSTLYVGSFINQLLHYLKSNRGALNFYHLITESILFKTLSYDYLNAYQKHKRHKTYEHWFEQATNDLSCLKEFLSAHVSRIPLSQTTDQIWLEHEQKYKFSASKAAVSSLERLLSRQDLGEHDRTCLGRDFFCHSYQFLSQFFDLEKAWSAENAQVHLAFEILAHYCEQLSSAGSALDHLVLRSDLNQNLTRCFDDINAYLNTLSPEQMAREFSCIEHVLEFLQFEFQQRTMTSHSQHLSGLAILPLEAGLAYPYQVVMVCGLSDPLFTSKHLTTSDWLAYKLGTDLPYHHHLQPAASLTGMSVLWARIPYQIYSYQLTDNHDQSIDYLLADWQVDSSLHHFNQAHTTLDQLTTVLFHNHPNTTDLSSPPPLPDQMAQRTHTVPSDSSKPTTIGSVAKVDAALFHSIAPSSWDILLQCPYRFYLKQKRLRTLALPTTHHHMEKGKWLHKLMDCFWNGIAELNTQAFPYFRDAPANSSYRSLSADDDLSAAGLLRRLKAIGDCILPPISFIKADEWHQFRLECLPYIAHVFAHLFAHLGWPTRIFVEHKIDGAEFETDILNSSPYAISITGRIDLLLIFEDGSSILVDYKTNKVPAVRALNTLKESQLLLYRYTLQKHNPALAYWALENNIFQWVYQPAQFAWQLPKDLPGSGQQPVKPPYFTQQAELDELTQQHFDMYCARRDEIAATQCFAIKPDQETCQYCDYAQICRKDDPPAI